MGALTPTGYTRIGPALRHATALLDREPAERKLLRLVTDGKPNDYDRYEGAHGVADVRQATREAAQGGICAHAIGIDPSAARAADHVRRGGGASCCDHAPPAPPVESLLDLSPLALGEVGVPALHDPAVDLAGLGFYVSVVGRENRDL